MNRSSRTTGLLAVFGATLGLLSMGAALAETHRDPKAEAIVVAVEKAIAPENGWSKVGGLRFTFMVVKDGKPLAEVHHVWDVHSGQYRVDWKDADGMERLALFNLASKGRLGEAYMKLDRKEQSGAESGDATPEASAPRRKRMPSTWTEAPAPMARKMLETGYGRFINDTYWLLMPLKMRDPGVNLAYDGEKTIGSQTYDVLKLTFDNVGLTPGDTYWVYVNRDSHLIDRWEYILEGEAKKAAGGSSEPAKEVGKPERTIWIWKDWKSFGPVKLATVKTMEDGSTSIVLKDVEAMSSVAASEFQAPVATHARPAAKPKG